MVGGKFSPDGFGRRLQLGFWRGCRHGERHFTPASSLLSLPRVSRPDVRPLLYARGVAVGYSADRMISGVGRSSPQSSKRSKPLRGSIRTSKQRRVFVLWPEKKAGTGLEDRG